MSIFREHKTIADRSASDRGRHKKKIEQAIRIGVAIVYFVLPFQFDRLFGFNAALMAIFLEIIIFIVYEYYLNKIKKTRKAIKV